MEPEHSTPHPVEGERTCLKVLEPLKNILGCEIGLCSSLNIELHLQIQDHPIQVHRALKALRTSIAEYTIDQHITIRNRLVHKGVHQFRILRARNREHILPNNPLHPQRLTNLIVGHRVKRKTLRLHLCRTEAILAIVELDNTVARIANRTIVLRN